MYTEEGLSFLRSLKIEARAFALASPRAEHNSRRVVVAALRLFRPSIVPIPLLLFDFENVIYLRRGENERETGSQSLLTEGFRERERSKNVLRTISASRGVNREIDLSSTLAVSKSHHGRKCRFLPPDDLFRVLYRRYYNVSGRTSAARAFNDLTARRDFSINDVAHVTLYARAINYLSLADSSATTFHQRLPIIYRAPRRPSSAHGIRRIPEYLYAGTLTMAFSKK